MEWVAAAGILFVLAFAWTLLAILLWRKERHAALRRRINDYSLHR